LSGATVFIRFVSAKIDEDSHVSAGLFCAVYDLLDESEPEEYEIEVLWDHLRWFRRNLRVPFDYRLRYQWRSARSICWFRDTARDHITHAWEVVALLENRGVLMRTIKCHKTGYILYEDDVQVLAQPFADMRRLL